MTYRPMETSIQVCDEHAPAGACEEPAPVMPQNPVGRSFHRSEPLDERFDAFHTVQSRDNKEHAQFGKHSAHMNHNQRNEYGWHTHIPFFVFAAGYVHVATQD